MKHDFSLHIEVAAEKRTAKKGRAGDESAGREEVEAVGNHGRHGRARLASVHKQDLLIIFLRLCYGVSCGELSAMFG
ncbi:hypothetical protein [Pseudomonas fluorescens]|uniref:hypothetical protein n=1 Tax=Pseudomonas fluorescens TaxID=294 RepID=UPI0011CE6051|nr:hypothetical protein [Pseudomonas fluorescens]